MTLLSNLVVVFGTLMALSGVPQVLKIFKRRSAKDISLVTYIILLIGGFFWILYGFEIGNFPILITNFIGTVVVSLIIFGWFIYGRN